MCEPGICPVEGKCTETSTIYKATLKTQNQEEFKYIGLPEIPSIDIIRQHYSSFKVHDPRNSTSLSKKVKELQRKNTLFEINWKILQKSKSYTAGSEECRLCVAEIYFILFSADTLLNSRSAFLNKCRHNIKFKLSNT